MLKQPDRIVIYPQKDSKPDYLLCWIPPGNFALVSGGNAETESELKEYYPTGIETEFSQEGFDEFGISIPYDLDALREAYLELSKAGMFDEVDFVDLKRLQKYVAEKDDNKIQELVEKLSEKDIELEEVKQEPVLGKLLEEPKSTGREDPGEAFQRLSGNLEPRDI